MFCKGNTSTSCDVVPLNPVLRKIIVKGLTVSTTYGVFHDCIKTEDWNGLDPDAPKEFKYYAPGIGLVREEIEGSSEFVDLISIQ